MQSNFNGKICLYLSTSNYVSEKSKKAISLYNCSEIQKYLRHLYPVQSSDHLVTIAIEIQIN